MVASRPWERTPGIAGKTERLTRSRADALCAELQSYSGEDLPRLL